MGNYFQRDITQVATKEDSSETERTPAHVKLLHTVHSSHTENSPGEIKADDFSLALSLSEQRSTAVGRLPKITELGRVYIAANLLAVPWLSLVPKSIRGSDKQAPAEKHLCACVCVCVDSPLKIIKKSRK